MRLEEFVRQKLSTSWGEYEGEYEGIDLHFRGGGGWGQMLRVIVSEAVYGTPSQFFDDAADDSTRTVQGLVYKDPSSYEYETIFQTRVAASDIKAIMAAIRAAQAAFKRATKISPLTPLSLMPPTYAPPDDAPEFRHFLAMRVKRELERRVKDRVMTTAGAALSRSGLPRNVRELVLRKV
jgi:hypothetical protein